MEGTCNFISFTHFESMRPVFVMFRAQSQCSIHYFLRFSKNAHCTSNFCGRTAIVKHLLGKFNPYICGCIIPRSRKILDF